MEFKVEELAPCRKKIAVTVPVERITEAFESKFDEVNQQIALPGFRPGKAPRRLLEARFADKLGDDIKGDLVKSALETLAEEKKVQPLAPPEIDVEAIELSRTEPMTFEFELLVRPEFETPKYEGLEVKVPPIAITDEQIDGAVDDLRRRSAKLEGADGGKVEDEDILVVDWEAKEGDSVEAKDSNHYYPYGRGVIAGFVAESIDEQLAGKKVGATASATVQVAADDPREELRDRELALTVTLKEIKRYVLPEIDEDFLKAQDFDDVEELRAETKKGLTRNARRGIERDAEEKLVEQLTGAIEMSLPEEFVKDELEQWAQRRRVELQMEGTDEADIDKSVEEGRGDAKTSIESDLRRYFLLDRIAEEADVQVTEAEMVQALQEIAQMYRQPIEAVMAQFRDGGRLAELRSQIRHRKVKETIRGSASLVEDPSLAGEDEAKPKKAAKKKAAKKKAKKKSAKK